MPASETNKAYILVKKTTLVGYLSFWYSALASFRMGWRWRRGRADVRRVRRGAAELCGRSGGERYIVPRSMRWGCIARRAGGIVTVELFGSLLNRCCWPRRAIKLPRNRSQTQANHHETD